MAQPPKDQPDNIKKDIAEMEAAYRLFVTKINTLKQQHKAKIAAILKRIDQRKIKQILTSLK
jgi:hypothetical protein